MFLFLWVLKILESGFYYFCCFSNHVTPSGFMLSILLRGFVTNLSPFQGFLIVDGGGVIVNC